MAAHVELEAISNSPLTDVVIDRIKAYIDANDLLPGDRLPGERELAGALGVSRNVMREATRVLQATGLLEVQRGNGIFVSEVNFAGMTKHFGFGIKRQPNLMNNLIEARILFEKGILDMVGPSITPEQIAWLEEANVPLTADMTWQEAVDIDLEFHRRLVEMTANPILMEYVSLLIRFFEDAAVVSPEEATGPVQDHCEIIEALRQGDINQAKTSLERGIRRWGGNS